MTNVNVTVKGNKMLIEVDLTKEQGLSKSGKTTLIASSGGNQAVAGPEGKTVYVGLNVYRK